MVLKLKIEAKGRFLLSSNSLTKMLSNRVNTPISAVEESDGEG
jgi:hypothetical protein